MTEPSARVLLDSISPAGHRLTTMEVVIHRFVLAEFNTHRVFSRNSASSRAIPVEKRLAEFLNDSAQPISYPAEHPGMQGGTELTGDDLDDARTLLGHIHNDIAQRLQHYLELHPQKSHRLHKSVLNRYLEPFLWHTVIVSSIEWDNFFSQRCSPLAQPEIRVAAEAMRTALQNSTPTYVSFGDWHLPLVQPDEQTEPLHVRQAISVARCARVSYLTHEGKRDIREDLKLFQRLVTAHPPHWSPLEHAATPISSPNLPGNFHGWQQLRHDPGRTDVILQALNRSIGAIND